MISPTDVHEVLVIEDNPADVYLIREGFKECGFHCQLTIASSKQEATLVLQQREFDLILCDFGTDPVEAGQFIQGIRAQHRLTPIIVVSAFLSVDAVYAAGANAFVQKTAEIDDFFKKIRILMEFWVQVAELPRRGLPLAFTNRAVFVARSTG